MLSIRTQDRMSLVPYDKQITVSKSNQFNMVFDNGDTLPLGTYATKERALEVLDEIEQYSKGRLLIPTNELQKEKYNWITNNGIITTATSTHIEVLPQVYQMPKE